MKRLAMALFVLVLLVDQAIKAAINTYVPDGQVVWIGEEAMLQAGHLRHYASMSNFAPALIANIVTVLLIMALLRNRLPSAGWRKLWIPVALLGAEFVTQTIDVLGRGYAIDYIGYGIRSLNYGEIFHLGDLAALAGIFLTPCFAALSFRATSNHVLRELAVWQR